MKIKTEEKKLELQKPHVIHYCFVNSRRTLLLNFHLHHHLTEAQHSVREKRERSYLNIYFSSCGLIFFCVAII